MNYISTRDTSKKTFVSSATAIKQGIATDGGLFVPTELPKIDETFVRDLVKCEYHERAAKILSLFLTDYTYDELLKVCGEAYNENSFVGGAAPISKVGENYFLELWHGPTCAFKDLALQLLPRLLSLSLDKTGEKGDALILVATSGDTGKAALEGYHDVDRVKIMVFYPNDGVSNMQKKQMATQKGENVSVVAINGNFDDAQSGVKKIFADKETIEKLSENGYFLSSANSINWGRLAPQIVYYFSAYCDLLAEGELEYGETLNVTVPTGNFGNILACYIAKKMGLPIGTLVCATNKNNILADFFESGKYDKRRPFYTTVSPSMDILISSNLERLLWFTEGSEFTKAKMSEFSENNYYETEKGIFPDFVGGTCNEENTFAKIKEVFEKYGYCVDPHTAVAAYVADEYKKTDAGKMLVVSTASPYKFPYAVAEALGICECADDFEMLDKVSEYTKTEIPEPLKKLKNASVRFGKTVEPSKMKDEVVIFGNR